MEQLKQVGASLGKGYKLEEGPISDLLLKLDGTDAISPALSTFLPPVMMFVPEHYLNRAGRRTDICGAISEELIEYAQGFRFFSSSGDFFRENGQELTTQRSSNDLVSKIPSPMIDQYDAPLSPYLWVHPQHVTVRSFFTKLKPGKSRLAVGRRYLNRMGFVVEISGCNQVIDGSMVFRDNELIEYGESGLREDDSLSLLDLEYEIRNWSVFSTMHWSSERVQKVSDNDQDIPELFNPFGEDRTALKKELLKNVLRIYEIAGRLGIICDVVLDTRENKDG